MKKTFASMAVAGLLIGCGTKPVIPPAAPVPAALNPSANEEPFLTVEGTGHQIYVCTVEPPGGAPGWRLLAPGAVLTDTAGKIVGHHGVGPSWTSQVDGSGVVGQAVANVASPDAGSIQWLLIKTKPYQNPGVLTLTTSIQRLETRGGVAPSTGCIESVMGQRLTVPYSAKYVFWRAKTGAK